MRKPEPQDFSELAALYAGVSDVDLPVAKKGGFGSATLRCNGKIFAMCPDGQSLVVKLPAARVAELVAAGDATPYSSGSGKVMKEWAAIPAARTSAWAAITEEALAFCRRGAKSGT